MFRLKIVFVLVLFSQSQSYNNSRSVFFLGDSQGTGFWEKYLLGRESNDSIPQIIFKRVKELRADSSLTVHLGDMVYSGADKDDWLKFDLQRKKMQLLPVLGNHEYFGNDQNAMINLYQRFPWLKSKSWYTKIYGRIAFIFLNSNFTKLSNEENKEQLRWFKKKIESFNDSDEVSGIIIVSHHPPFTNGGGLFFSANTDLQEKYLPVLDTIKKVKAFISGHCHSYEHFLKKGVHYIVSGGAGGPRRELVESDVNIDISGISGSLRDFNFIELKIDRNSLNFIVHMYNKKDRKWYVPEQFKINL